MKFAKVLTLVTFLCVVAVLLVEAQAKNATGKIKGTILDANDARVVNAVVRIYGGETKRGLKSNSEGQFEISLPAGYYESTVEANSFRRFVYSSLKVQPGQTEMINIHLDVAPPKGLVPAS